MPNTILWQNSQLRIVSPEKAPSEQPYIIQEVGDNDLVTGEPMWFGVAPERKAEHLYTIIRGMAEELDTLRASALPKTITLRDIEYRLFHDGIMTNGDGTIILNLMQQDLLAIRTESPVDTLAHSTGQQIYDALHKYSKGVVVFSHEGPRHDPSPVFLRTVIWPAGRILDVAGIPDRDGWATLYRDAYAA